MIVLISLGLFMALNQIWIGIIPFVGGLLMATGFKILSESPREVGLISVLGKKTDIKVEGLVLTFTPFGWKIVDVVVFKMVRKDIEFPITNIVCHDKGIISGTVSLSISPGESGQDLKDFDDSDQLKGVEQQLNDIILVGVQRIADIPEHTAHYMTTRRVEIGKELKRIIEGKISGDSTEDDDQRNLGIKIHKLQINLVKDKRVIDAEQQSLVTDVMNTRIQKRLEFYREKGETPLPSAAKIRADLLEEDRNSQGLIKEVRGGGINVNET